MTQVKNKTTSKQSMALDTKSKNEDIKEIAIKKILIIFVLTCLFLYLIYMIISKNDFQWIYDYNPILYYETKNTFELLFNSGLIYILLLIFLTIILFIICIYQQRKVKKYINSLSDASEKLFSKEDEYISLPDDLYMLETKLNRLRTESLINEKKAQESKQKNEELIINLAHDIKTPLTSMIGYLSLLDEIKDLPKDKSEKYIKIILNKSYRIEELINELFDIARFNSEKIILEKEELNLNLMLSQIIEDYYPMLLDDNKKITLDINENINIYADSFRFSRVINNLIKNAVNYSYKDTSINVKAYKLEDKVIIEVSNLGKQIPEEKLNRLFERFYRVDSSRGSEGGSGLGLAIAKEIVELHGGKISAFIKDNLITFKVEIPS